jgi:hypothetical protein
MNRRPFLAACGLGIGAFGGCLGVGPAAAPSLPEGVRVSTTHLEADALADGSDRNADFPEWKAEYHTVVADEAAAADRLVDDSPVDGFVAETNFDESVLIVVQNGMQSEMVLVLDAIERREAGLRLDVSIDAPQGGPDDLRIHSLLVRLTDSDRRVPESVAVDIEGYV